MKRWAMMVGAVLVCACGAAAITRPYQNSDLELSPAYTAKEACSCIFVMGQTEEYCRAWTKASPDVATFRVDSNAKAVEASALLLWGARARFVDERTGCVLE